MLFLELYAARTCCATEHGGLETRSAASVLHSPEVRPCTLFVVRRLPFGFAGKAQDTTGDIAEPRATPPLGHASVAVSQVLRPRGRPPRDERGEEHA